MFNEIDSKYSKFSQFFLKVFFPRLMRLNHILQEKLKAKENEIMEKDEAVNKILNDCAENEMEKNKIEYELIRAQDEIRWYKDQDRIIMIRELETELEKIQRENRILRDQYRELVPLDQILPDIKAQWLNFHISKLNSHSSHCSNIDNDKVCFDKNRKKRMLVHWLLKYGSLLTEDDVNKVRCHTENICDFRVEYDTDKTTDMAFAAIKEDLEKEFLSK